MRAVTDRRIRRISYDGAFFDLLQKTRINRYHYIEKDDTYNINEKKVELLEVLQCMIEKK